MNVNQMRGCIKNSIYKSAKWNARVDKMSDQQIIAVYYKLLNNNQLDTKAQPKSTEEQLCFSF